ncbi:MAG: hypothetical protein ABFR65_07880 [Pseudomonadota bacterium]
MDWTKIIWAVLLGAMILFLWPRAKHMLKHSPKAESGDWQAVVVPILFVVGFVILLIMMV